MHNGIKTEKIRLSTGAIYTPEKGNPPVYPCSHCEKARQCAASFDVCPAYMDYEHMTAIYRRTVFD